jgi:hypothetical protein
MSKTRIFQIGKIKIQQPTLKIDQSKNLFLEIKLKKKELFMTKSVFCVTFLKPVLKKTVFN